MRTANKGMILLRTLEGADRFTLDGKKYQVVVHSFSYPLSSRVWVYDFAEGRSILVSGTLEIPQDQVQLFAAG